MSSADSTEAPIYAGLAEEHGDVPAEVRRVAEEVLREADRAIDFGTVRTAAAAREAWAVGRDPGLSRLRADMSITGR